MKYPTGPGINTLTTEEVVIDLIDRDKNSCGLEFVDVQYLHELRKRIKSVLAIPKAKKS